MRYSIVGPYVLALDALWSWNIMQQQHFDHFLDAFHLTIVGEPGASCNKY